MLVPFCSNSDTSQHYRTVGPATEFRYGPSAVLQVCLSIYSLPVHVFRSDGLFDQIKHLDPIGEYNAASS